MMGEERSKFVLEFSPTDNHEPPIHLVARTGKFFEVEPLCHASLVALLVEGKTSFPLEIHDLVLFENEGDPAAKSLTFSSLMEVKKAPELFGLVLGGWLPFPFAARETVLLDHSVVSYIERISITERAKPELGAAHPEWPYSSFFFCGQKTSPFLYAFEGHQRRPPRYAEIVASLQKGEASLRRVLPQAQVQSASEVQVHALHQLVLEATHKYQGHTRFLQEVSPLVAQPKSRKQARKVEQQLLASAERNSIAPASFTFAAALSCLYDQVPLRRKAGWKAIRPGRAVIKPSDPYSDTTAYNAIIDLFFLEFLCHSHIVEEAGCVFYTRDIGLAALWSALAPYNPRIDRPGISRISVSLSNGLMPALPQEEALRVLRRMGWYY